MASVQRVDGLTLLRLSTSGFNSGNLCVYLSSLSLTAYLAQFHFIVAIFTIISDTPVLRRNSWFVTWSLTFSPSIGHSGFRSMIVSFLADKFVKVTVSPTYVSTCKTHCYFYFRQRERSLAKTCFSLSKAAYPRLILL